MRYKECSRKLRKFQRILSLMESSRYSGEAKSNRPGDHINLSVNFEEALLWAHSGQVTTDFATLIMIGERIEDGMNSGKLIDLELLWLRNDQETPIRKSKLTEERTKAREKVGWYCIGCQNSSTPPKPVSSAGSSLFLFSLQKTPPSAPHPLSMLIDQSHPTLLLLLLPSNSKLL